jgi:hypothetical protein
MEVHVGDKTLKLRFGYEIFFDTVYTSCEVKQVTDKEDILISESLVRKHPKTNHSKFAARRIALARAIADIDRSERAEIWKGYLAKVRMPK